jgi:hypothetical protein
LHGTLEVHFVVEFFDTRLRWHTVLELKRPHFCFDALLSFLR